MKNYVSGTNSKGEKVAFKKVSENVKPWSQVKPFDLEEFTKITNAKNEEIGIKLVNTFSNRKPGAPLTKPTLTK